jgi:hypothetical protein
MNKLRDLYHIILHAPSTSLSSSFYTIPSREDDIDVTSNANDLHFLKRVGRVSLKYFCNSQCLSSKYVPAACLQPVIDTQWSMLLFVYLQEG